jgi:succinate dehydrogenase / fumarate reductase membrane anchor subunit
MVERTVVGAHYGLRDWLAQRVTAVIMALYSGLFIVLLISRRGIDFAAWRSIFDPQWMKLATLLFLLSLYYHAWVGVRNIFMDYIKPTGLRLTLHVATIVWLVVCGVWSVQILWGMS